MNQMYARSKLYKQLCVCIKNLDVLSTGVVVNHCLSSNKVWNQRVGQDKGSFVILTGLDHDVSAINLVNLINFLNLVNLINFFVGGEH
ncbi:hypothetical protein Hanom_Chr08g00747871 [Helianthus anomalus]